MAHIAFPSGTNQVGSNYVVSGITTDGSPTATITWGDDVEITITYIKTPTIKADSFVPATTGATMTFTGNVSVTGDINIGGAHTSTVYETLTVNNNMIVINEGMTGAPPSTLTSGLQVNRGTSADNFLQYEESTELWKLGLAASLQTISTREDAPTDNTIPVYDSTTKKYDSDANFTYDSSILSVPGISCSGNISGTLTTAAQTNVTSVGTLTSLAVDGDITAGTGNTHDIGATGTRFQDAWFNGTVTAGTIAGTLSTAAQTNVTSVGMLTSLAVDGDITAGTGNIHDIGATGTRFQDAWFNGTVTASTISGTTISGTTLTGTLSTAAQTNVTSVGMLTSLAVDGHITAGGGSIYNIGSTGTRFADAWFSGTVTAFDVNCEQSVTLGTDLNFTSTDPVSVNGNITVTYRYNSEFGALMEVNRARDSGGSLAKVEDNDTLYQFKFKGYDGTDYEEGAAIHIKVDGATSSNTMPTGIVFFTRDTADTAVQTRAILDRTGALSIGNGDTIASAGALIDMTSTTRGLMLPRMSTSQRDAVSAANGLLLYENEEHVLNIYAESQWYGISPQWETFSGAFGTEVGYITSYANYEYCKLGGLLFFWVNVGWTAKMGTATEYIRIILPESVNAARATRMTATVMYVDGINYSNQLVAGADAGNNHLWFWEIHNDGSAPVRLIGSDTHTTGDLQVSGFYPF